jgi:hypothetical protein
LLAPAPLFAPSPHPSHPFLCCLCCHARPGPPNASSLPCCQRCTRPLAFLCCPVCTGTSITRARPAAPPCMRLPALLLFTHPSQPRAPCARRGARTPVPPAAPFHTACPCWAPRTAAHPTPRSPPRAGCVARRPACCCKVQPAALPGNCQSRAGLTPVRAASAAGQAARRGGAAPLPGPRGTAAGPAPAAAAVAAAGRWRTAGTVETLQSAAWRALAGRAHEERRADRQTVAQAPGRGTPRPPRRAPRERPAPAACGRHEVGLKAGSAHKAPSALGAGAAAGRPGQGAQRIRRLARTPAWRAATGGGGRRPAGGRPFSPPPPRRI